jgi:hypothetical protein
MVFACLVIPSVRLFFLVRAEATVHVDNLPCNKTCTRRDKPLDSLSNIFGFTPSLEEAFSNRPVLP